MKTLSSIHKSVDIWLKKNASLQIKITRLRPRFTVFKLHRTNKDVLNVETRGGCIKFTEFTTCKYVVLNVETVTKAKKTSTMKNF